MKLDYESLRKDLSNYTLGAYFGGKVGAAILYYERIQKADEEELIEIAKECNFPIEDYITDNYERKK